MSENDQNQRHTFELGKLKFSTPSGRVALGAILVIGFVGLAWVLGTGRKVAPPAAEAASATYQPSAIYAARLLSAAVKEYGQTLMPPYTATLGSVYLPVIPYDVIKDNFSLSAIEKVDLMSTGPSVVRTSSNGEPQSIAYGMCIHIRKGSEIVGEVLGKYSSKVPEVLFSDIDRIHATKIYQHFIRYARDEQCDVMLGVLRNTRDREAGLQQRGLTTPYPIPFPEAKFSKRDFAAYIDAVQTMDRNVKRIVGEN